MNAPPRQIFAECGANSRADFFTLPASVVYLERWAGKDAPAKGDNAW